MRRTQVRQLKQAIRTEQDGTAMRALLARSIRFGHRRLALLRCLQAERMGIVIDTEARLYCQRIADAMAPEALRALMRQAST